MLVGHYAPAYALKARFERVPLWLLFLAVQAVDVLFFVLVPLGVEGMALRPGASGPLAMDLHHMPYTHSLTSAVLLALVCSGVGWTLGRPRLGAVVGAAVASHWLLDWVVHQPDLPLRWRGGQKVGLGLWERPIVSWMLEVGLLVAAYALFRRRLPAARRRWGDAGLVILCVVQTVNDFVLPPPPSVPALAAMAEATYLGLTLLVVPLDRPAPG